jgi:SAM-dependent methyltransferase
MRTRIMENDRETRGKRNMERYSTVRERYFREGRPSGFSGNGNGYAGGLLNIMNVKPHWTVLDMACADGGLTIPLAEKVRKVTAVDFSESMLEILKGRCREKGITNVKAIHGRWEDDWDSLGIGPHDVAIESRSIRADDLVDAAIKLDRVARKQVYISMAVGDGPFDRKVYEATGRKLNMGPSYTYMYYNVLHQHMGILANIAFVHEARESDWGSREEALDSQRWMFHELTMEEEGRLRNHLDEHLIYADGRWRLPYQRECRWAVMSWEKKGE